MGFKIRNNPCSNEYNPNTILSIQNELFFLSHSGMIVELFIKKIGIIMNYVLLQFYGRKMVTYVMYELKKDSLLYLLYFLFEIANNNRQILLIDFSLFQKLYIYIILRLISNFISIVTTFRIHCNANATFRSNIAFFTTVSNI